MPTTSTTTITLGHSPDPDDAFMFHALARGRIDTGDLRFEHILQDIQTLNGRARRGELDVTAISFHAYPHVADRYALLPCGASMGDGYGPMLVSLTSYNASDLERLRIAIPGELTSAFLALKLFFKNLGAQMDNSMIEIVPFDQIFNFVKAGKADVGLLIHEGQLTYAKGGFKLIVDLGAWWKERTGLPLPLGGNVIRKSLGTSLVSRISSILSASIRYGLDHIDETMPHLEPYARDLDVGLTRKFVRMYVNDYTVDYGDKGREAITRFLNEGAAAGFVPGIKKLEFA